MLDIDGENGEKHYFELIAKLAVQVYCVYKHGT